jgi:hypothetical protein
MKHEHEVLISGRYTRKEWEEYQKHDSEILRYGRYTEKEWNALSYQDALKAIANYRLEQWYDSFARQAKEKFLESALA